jgi:flagellar biogenesis protein FliO
MGLSAMPDASFVGAVPQQPLDPIPLTIASPDTAFHRPPELPLATYLFQFFLLTAIILVVGIFVLRYVRDKLPSLALPVGTGRSLRVVERVNVDPQRSAFVLAVGQRYWLLVASGDSVTPVAELSSQDLTPDFGAAVEKESRHGETA